jgi:hypothetical protein
MGSDRLRTVFILLVVLTLTAGSFAAAWCWQANAYGKVIATVEANHQADLTAIANAGAEQARKALAKQQDAEQKLAALDKDATEQKEKANAENESLRRAVADGCGSRAVVVPVAGTCPVPPAPPAWVMQAPSNSVEKLDKLFSISEETSLQIKQP